MHPYVSNVSPKRMMVDNQLMINCFLGVRGHRMNVLDEEPRCPTSDIHGGSMFIVKTFFSYDLSNHITMDEGNRDNLKKCLNDQKK